MDTKLNRDQCAATLELRGVRHVWCDSGSFTGYAMERDGQIWKPSYSLSRRQRRFACFTEIADFGGTREYRNGWSGWRIDELRMAVKQLVIGD